MERKRKTHKNSAYLFLMYLQMNSSYDDSDNDMDMYYLLAACIAEEGEKAPYSPRRLPLMTRLQWVQERMKDPKKSTGVLG
jgi:hypothetical protein